MTKYLTAQATAARLIKKAGSVVTLTRTVPGVVDPVTQTETGRQEVDYPFTVAVFPPSQQAKFRVGSLEGRNAVEIYFSLAGQTIRPQPGDRISIGGVDHALFWSQTYDPALDGAIFTIGYAERGAS
jgi:hypothetical protein